MASQPVIAFSLLGDISRNSRALRQIDALSFAGFHVVAFGFTHQQPSSIARNSSQITLAKYPPNKGPRLFLNAHKQFLKFLQQTNASIYHASDLYSLPASKTLAQNRNARLSFDSRELYCHVHALNGHPWKRKLWYLTEKHNIKYCDSIFTVSDRIATHLSETYQIDNPIVIPNVPDLSIQTKSNSDLSQLASNPDDLIVLHNGQIREGRGCLPLAQAAASLNNVSLVFMGDGPLRNDLIAFAQNTPRKNVHFVDPVPANEVIHASSHAALGAIMLEDSCLNHRYALPNKFFEYCAAGLAVLGNSLPTITDAIHRFDVGTTVDTSTPQEIARVLSTVADDRTVLASWQNNTRKVMETFNWEKASHAFVNAFKTLLDK